jgi:ABC-type branched-subunit amino acid transport system ATPase component
MLILEKVQKSFGALMAVCDVSLALGETGITGLIGPNGSGKSTLFHLITGFYRLDAGRITFNGESIGNFPPHVISRKGLVRTFQQTRVLPMLSTLDNLVAAAPAQAGERLIPLFFSPGRVRRQETAHRARAKEILERIHLAHMADVPAGRLSYGQQKLLEIGRVLMTQPRLIVLDEPTAGINPTLIRQLIEILTALRDGGLRIFLIEHNMPLVSKLCEHLFVMDAGELICAGPPGAVRNDPRVISAYLGRQTDAA